jgi:hypothetical protein
MSLYLYILPLNIVNVSYQAAITKSVVASPIVEVNCRADLALQLNTTIWNLPDADSL